MMKNKNILIVMLGLIVGVFGCADPDLAPILTFDDAKKAGYVKLIEESDKLVNLLSEQEAMSSTYTYSVEFVDQQNGQRVEEYYVNLVYEPVSGTGQTIEKYISFAQSDFVDGPNGLRAVLDISITGQEIFNALGLSYADVSPGDNFEFQGFLTFEGDGAVYGAANASAAVNGSAFAGHFDFTIPAACPSDLAGTFDYDGLNYWCGGTGSGTVNIVAAGGGVYGFSDWSFGAYAACYGSGASTGPQFTDVCTEVSYTNFVDSFGDTYSINASTIVGNVWTIDWEIAAWGESGTALIYYTGGADWPITLN